MVSHFPSSCICMFLLFVIQLQNVTSASDSDFIMVNIACIFIVLHEYLKRYSILCRQCIELATCLYRIGEGNGTRL